MNRLFNTMPQFHLLLQPYKTNIRKLFIFEVSLLFLLVANSCTDANTNKNGKPADSTAKKIEADTILPQAASQSDSFFIALKKGRKIYVGDFDTMLKRRIVRVLVPNSRTLFFNDKGTERGISADCFREFEQFLNKKYRKKPVKIPFTVVFIPTPPDQLIPGVLAGLGDIAAGNLTATEGRLKHVDFFAPKELGSFSELILTGKKDSAITNVEELAGKTVYVRKSSSYFESLEQLNKTLAAKGKPLVRLEIASEYLEDEDLMEMLDAGIVSVVIVDDWLAKMWAQILPNIRVNDVSIRSGGYIGWCFRKNSPLLTEELKDFYYNYEKKLGEIPYRLKKYYGQVKYLQDPTSSGNAKRYKEIMQLFEKYGKQYGFDPLMLAALGFQESRLDQNNRSAVGAIGVMQVMPSTGAAMKVGNITVTEPNIHAGTKFVNILITKYFKGAHFDGFNRALFAFASYNAGPARIERLRKVAATRGLNPNVWLGSVEVVASEKIGIETTTYVRNIVKYYCSYKLMLEHSQFH
ncbi:transglycosylase SLT domain-containing protein [Pinibacter soli]|uniref:Transporter substrate-binding domain-containing protein n=1 Tax=Pinibacter soli TaxID=3044211 RepID=A0ABT6RD90_9BACT|nr:transporter substrate-binding domain-containing protein [Pinibacter soli]MDI3319817.1 transporter substrate-binding domain-containing protein [Pinibacter soli]